MPGGNNLSVEGVSLIVDMHVGLEVPHNDKYFVVGKTKDEDYGWRGDAPLCSEGSYVFVYDQKRNNEMDAQKIHICFGCVLLTRSDILHGGYGGSIGYLRLRGTFHTVEWWKIVYT